MVKCSRNFELGKQTDQNFITQNTRWWCVVVDIFWLVGGGGW